MPFLLAFEEDSQGPRDLDADESRVTTRKAVIQDKRVTTLVGDSDGFAFAPAEVGC